MNVASNHMQHSQHQLHTTTTSVTSETSVEKKTASKYFTHSRRILLHMHIYLYINIFISLYVWIYKLLSCTNKQIVCIKYHEKKSLKKEFLISKWMNFFIVFVCVLFFWFFTSNTRAARNIFTSPKKENSKVTSTQQANINKLWSRNIQHQQFLP